MRVVQFLGRSRPKRKKTENTTVLELRSLSPEIITESSIFLLIYYFDAASCVPSAHKLLTSSATPQNKHFLPSQNDWCFLFDISSFRSLIRFSFFLLIVISLSFLQRSLQFLLIVSDAIVMVDCIVCFEYFKYCLVIIITR